MLMIEITRFAAGCLAIAPVILASGHVLAQKPSGLPNNYPSKPIRVIITSAPGGSIDINGRLFTTHLNERWGSVVHENRGGQGAGFAVVAAAAPDGYTLMVSGSSGHIGAELVVKPPYNVRTKFPPIAQFTVSSYVIAVNNDLPVKNIKEFIAYAKANPGKLNFAYATIGGQPHLFGELLKDVAGIDMQGIPYKGVGPSYVDQMAGRINMTIGVTASSLPHVRAGKIRAIAVTSEKRLKAMPDTPTMRESIPNFDVFGGGVGLFGVEGMNPAYIVALNKEANAMLARPEVEKALTADGSETGLGSTPESYRKYIADMLDSTARIVKKANIVIDAP
jgi:tripartite-type tricarboxylate transporter receptor subunit TctC